MLQRDIYIFETAITPKRLIMYETDRQQIGSKKQNTFPHAAKDDSNNVKMKQNVKAK
jgi:hypothetical protein